MGDAAATFALAMCLVNVFLAVVNVKIAKSTKADAIRAKDHRYCSCGHTSGMHRDGKKCNDRARRKTSYGKDWMDCRCTKFDGPPPPPTMDELLKYAP